MPLYEYYCPNCKAKFEMLVSHQHADDVVCMKCHSEKVRRLLSTFAFAGKSGESGNYDDPFGNCGVDGGSCGCNY